MSVSEVTTFGIQKQLLNERTELEEASVLSEEDVALQAGEGDVVTLRLADDQRLSQANSEVQCESGPPVQEISSVASAKPSWNGQAKKSPERPLRFELEKQSGSLRWVGVNLI